MTSFAVPQVEITAQILLSGKPLHSLKEFAAFHELILAYRSVRVK